MRATELWALSCGKVCEGEQSCHWCGAPCDPGTTHDDLPPVPFVCSKSLAFRPASPWICMGCDLFRRKRTTIRFLDGNAWRDGQCPMDWGWVMYGISSEPSVLAVRREDSVSLYKILMAPPHMFCLALLDPLENKPKSRQVGVKNLPHLWRVNESAGRKTGESLQFTVNNVPFDYAPYDLEVALSTKDAPMSPGVRALVRLFGTYPPLEAKKSEPTKQAFAEAKESAPKKETK